MFFTAASVVEVWCFVIVWVFFKKIWRTQVIFYGSTDTPVLWHLCISKSEWAALFVLVGGRCVTCSLIFMSGVKPADLLVASMAAEPITSTYLQAGIGRVWNQDVLCRRWMLYQLSYAGSAGCLCIFGEWCRYLSWDFCNNLKTLCLPQSGNSCSLLGTFLAPSETRPEATPKGWCALVMACWISSNGVIS